MHDLSSESIMDSMWSIERRCSSRPILLNTCVSPFKDHKSSYIGVIDILNFEARLLCEGEAKSLEEIHDTNTVKCPKVIKGIAIMPAEFPLETILNSSLSVFESSKGTWNLVCDFVDMEEESAAHKEKLGEEMAK